MPFIRVDDIQLHYEAAGDGPDTLVLVHAYPANCRLWQPQVEFLSARRRIIAYDVRGFGRSDAPDAPQAYSQERSVADLLGLLNALGLQKPALCGLSMGGNIALNFALRHAERVSRLVVSGTGAGSDDASAFARVTNTWADIAERDGIEAFADAIMANPIFGEYAERGPSERLRLREMILANTVRGVAHTARQVLAKRPTITSLAPRLKMLPMPTLVIVGEKDSACHDPGQLMANTIPRARLSVIPSTGHFNNLENPSFVSSLLDDFLASDASVG